MSEMKVNKVLETEVYGEIYTVALPIRFFFNKDGSYDGIEVHVEGVSERDQELVRELCVKLSSLKNARMGALELLDVYGWPDIWHPDKDSWFVGIWHKGFDLCIVKWCDTEEEAENLLSPEGKTLQEAIEFAVLKVKKAS